MVAIFSYIGGAAFLIGFNVLSKNDMLGLILMGVGIVASVVYFYNQQKNN